jgi:hypothetical protein
MNANLSIGKRNCTRCTHATIHLQRPFYITLLALAMLAMAAGGLFSGCRPMEESPSATGITSAGHLQESQPPGSGTKVPPLIPKYLLVHEQLKNIFTVLKIPAVSQVNDSIVSPAIVTGDIIQFGYHENADNVNYILSINQQLSTTDTLVFDGTTTNTVSGQVRYIRHTITQSGDGITVNKIRTIGNKPPSENFGWTDDGTFKYVPTTDGVLEYEILPDGTDSYQAKYSPKTETSVTKTNKSGTSHDLSGISVKTLHKLNTSVPR